MSDIENVDELSDEPVTKEKTVEGNECSSQEEEAEVEKEVEPPAKRIRRSTRKTKITEVAQIEKAGEDEIPLVLSEVEEPSKKDEESASEERSEETKKKSPKTPTRKSKRTRGRKKAAEEVLDNEEEKYVKEESDIKFDEFPLANESKEEPSLELKVNSDIEINPEYEIKFIAEDEKEAYMKNIEGTVTEDLMEEMELGEIPFSPEPANEVVEDKNSTVVTIEEGEVNNSLEHRDTEMISEDELPSDGPKVPLDTEAVSDEELPGATQPEIIDSEAVSEDELHRAQKALAAHDVYDMIKVMEDKNSTVDTIEEGEVNDSLEHHDTEMVSEDEFPSDGPKVPLDTEAVSDEELPGPTQAELLDTEAVSEDELPPVKKKRKHRRHSSDSEKRQKSDKDKESSKRSRDSKSPTSKKDKDSKSSSKLKSLPELDKYWKAVREDPSDFTGWTYLLQYVDQENDVEAAREAYDKFLSHYPYCYGYWRKYADYEKRKGGETSKCEDVFERGLNAIPLSVDLWLHYLNFCKTAMKDDEEKLRSQFERALEQCGLEFRSDRLWDCYIKWEIDNKNYNYAYAIFNRLLSTPTQGYKTHFESFEDFIRSHHPNKILGVDEFLELRAEIVQKIKEKGLPMEPSAAPPGDESEGDEETSSSHADEETALMREKLISAGKKIFKETISEVVTRWNFEEGIKRPYFHVKPLERCQLNTWREYLDYEIGIGSEKRTIVLFERCLIACALYEEFWVKYIKYLEGLPGDREEEIRKVYYRACTIHHPKKPYLALNWASFEESKVNFEGARKVLIQIEKEVPSMMLVHLRRINLERRAGNIEEAAKLYESYIANTKSRSVFVTLSVKYSRFCWKVCNDSNKGIEILRKAIDKNPEDIRLYVQLLDLLMLQPNMNESACINVFDKIIERDSVDLEDKIIFAQRRIEFLEDFGSDIKSVQKAQSEYFGILKQLKEARRHPKLDDKSKTEDSKKGKSDSTTALSSQSNSYSSSTYSHPPTSYSSTYQSSGQYPQQNYSQTTQNSSQYSSQPDQNSSTYQNWNYSQSNYGNGNQSWGGYNYYS